MCQKDSILSISCRSTVHVFASIHYDKLQVVMCPRQMPIDSLCLEDD